MTADHVLIKGSHDSGTIDGAYGPYTQAEAQWLYDEFLSDGTCYRWTIVKLATFASDTVAASDPEPASEPDSDALQRDPRSTTSCTAERRGTYDRPRTTSHPFGFALPRI